ncbi:phosphoglucosamine mutase [soil metagenome]
MARKYFGTDGIRGRVGERPITPDFVLRLGAAAGRILTDAHRAAGRGAARPQVLIGKDTRISGYMLESALEAGLSSAGVDVLLCGPLPTPGVAYLTRALRLDAGVVISASHNRFDDNGLKAFGRDGGKLPDAVEERVEAMLEQHERDGLPCVSSAELGRARRLDDASGRYIEFCKSTFPADADLRGLHIMVDCAHGAAYQTAPSVFHELGARVTVIAPAPDGFNINAGVGAMHPEHLAERVLAEGADIGIALDGDADRLVVVDATGRIYSGDELLYAIVMDRHRRSPVAGAVGTLMTNLAVENAFAAEGIGFARAKVGDRYVLEELNARGWLHGGEGSGHLICLDKHTTGDGTISALQLLAAMVRSGSTPAELLDGVVIYPQTLINVGVPRGFDWKSHAGIATASKAVEQSLGKTGRVLIRPSGTEPVLRVMVEAQDESAASLGAQAIAEAVEAVAATT